MSFDKSIELNFGKAANTYDESAVLHKEIANNLLQLIYESIESGNFPVPNSILDVGAGTGLLAAEFLKIFKETSVTLNDISSEMLNVAANKFQKINFLHGNAEEENLTGYDMIISSMSFQWFKDIEFFVERSLRYCEKIAFSIPVLGTFCNWYELLDTLKLHVPRIKYKSRNEILSFCNSLDLSYKKFAEKKYIMEFNSTKDFMRYLKLIGANISGYQHNIDSIKELISIRDPLQVSYEVFFVVLARE
jgi:malonyl-CoA O-methyltransferase